MADNPQAGAGRPLPKKEADTFKNLVKYYESKQYKKAVKQADAILKKYPNHGETLAMKGLTLNYMNKKDEAHALVKQGLMNDMRSHVCWHVYGLLYRSDRDYNEAIKAYKQALRIDPENMQILRDLSMLQIQMRDLEGFAVTRNALLSLKPNAKINWMAYALARHLIGDLEGAVKVIDTYTGTLSEGSQELGRCFESSELALYKNTILAEIPDNYKAALDHLNVCESIVVDRANLLMMKAIYQIKLKQFAPARETVMLIFDRGMTENYQAHSLYMIALLELDSLCDEALQLKGTSTIASMMPLSEKQKKVIDDAYKNELFAKFPRSHAVQRIPIQLLDGDDLRQALDVRCRRDLTRGVPSLIDEVCSYILTLNENNRYIRPRDPVHIKVHPLYEMLVDMVDGYIKNLNEISKFAADDLTEEPPSTLLWAWFLRAGLHDLVKEYVEGIALLDKCLEHTPTAVDVYEMKGRMLKGAGDIQTAAECLDKGRDLDRQDRYINNQTTKYLLQAGNEKEALNRISMFTKHEGNPEQNLYDMQCSWYELELAECLSRKASWGRSLKKYAAVVKHYDDFNEDQFDFHNYCLRKVTLRSYIATLRFEDKVYGQDYYTRAARGIVRIYLHLHDKPEVEDEEEPDFSKMTAVERKKAKAIARKKKKAQEKRETDTKEKQQDAENGDKKNPKGDKTSFVDEDPNGLELLKKDPLEEAGKYSAMLVRYAPKDLDTWILRYDVAIRRKKVLMALQAIYKARAIDAESGDLFTRIIDFATKMDSFSSVSNEVLAILNEEFPSILGNRSLTEFIQSAAQKAQNEPLTNLPLKCAIAKAMVDVKVSDALVAAKLITEGGLSSSQVSVESCLAALDLLKTFGDDASSARVDWETQVNGRFPLLKQSL